MLRQTASHAHLTSAEIVGGKWHYGKIPANARTYLVMTRNQDVKVITVRWDQVSRVVAEYRANLYILDAVHIATRDKGNLSAMHLVNPRRRMVFPVTSNRA